MKMKRNKAYFSISAVAKMFSVHQQTIRLYEKEGLLSPKRSDGNTRLFSEDDVDRLEEVIYLTHELGINLAGVQMILKLKKQIAKMQQDMNKVFDDTQKQLDAETESSKEIIKTRAQQLLNLKQHKALTFDHTQPSPAESKETEEQPQLEIDNWDIEYESE
jgi:MerR family transcriptional regulator, heat shock protein HspR